MFLQRLSEYADQFELPPFMYQPMDIRYEVQLEGRSGVVTVIDRQTEAKKRGKKELAPHAMKTSGVKSRLLAENAEYALGTGRKDSKPVQVQERHAEFMRVVDSCATATAEPTVRAVAASLADMQVGDLQLPPDFDPKENVTFRVDGIRPIDLQSVRTFWKREGASETTEPMQCLICGNIRPAVKVLPIQFKGIPGGQSSGAALISFNASAFDSYGLDTSVGAPTCEECGWRFSNSLNELLQGEQTHLRIDPVVYIFWTRKPLGISWANILTDPSSEDAREFLRSAWTSKSGPSQNFDTVPFYAAMLSGAKSRVIVRDWLETTLGAARENLMRYFRLQRLVGYDRKDRQFRELQFPLRALMQATVSANSKVEEPAPQVGQALLRLALHGDPLPQWLMYQAVRRARAEQGVRTEHAALIKMVLLTQNGWNEGENNMAELDLAEQRAGYLCGRLLAELEAIQYAALGKTNRTIVDSYYGTASSAPATVFGRLMTGARAHLTKLRHEKPGAHLRLDRRLQEIMAGLPSFPRTLTLKDQGLFALGYYHQKAADFKAIQERKATRGGAIAPDDVDEVEGIVENE